ncbi:hypothetical protein D3C81_2136890 [compost metagenome]
MADGQFLLPPNAVSLLRSANLTVPATADAPVPKKSPFNAPLVPATLATATLLAPSCTRAPFTEMVPPLKLMSPVELAVKPPKLAVKVLVCRLLPAPL